MPTCQNCNNKWSWKQTIKKTTTLNPAINCPYCGEKQYQTQKSKTKISFLTVMILLPLLINIFFDIPGAILLSLFPVLFIIAMLLYPFLVEISSREEYINFF
ncbi:cxxc_20_cxxc protein [Lentibacillus halodurans]|uniref:Cxxc_20_cxxc protein n=1 Tax=Lentibacillus halodurans TaxID=237679 RepID=A0A1I1AEX6_9BACI|nr:TIGR04104 family putative zinc finger protein [Lentibacillus halodurans]SFB36507.1 cxxc_20_cxxc protein [Lentibacillus halodurans]